MELTNLVNERLLELEAENARLLKVVEAAQKWGAAELGDAMIVAEQDLARELDEYAKT